MIAPTNITQEAPGNNNDGVLWRERERRQRTIRLLMMFLLMLLLMDSDENARRQHKLKRRRRNLPPKTLDVEVFESRRRQEAGIHRIASQHPRYQALVTVNEGEDVERAVVDWAKDRAEQEKDQFPESAKQKHKPEVDPEQERTVYHYPWNATGFYRGEWSRKNYSAGNVSSSQPTNDVDSVSGKSKIVDATQLEDVVAQIAANRSDMPLGVFLLPDNLGVRMRDDNNLTSLQWEELRTDSNNEIVKSPDLLFSKQSDENKLSKSIPLTQDSGRLAFHFFSRSVPAMKELSLVDGFIKIYDSKSIGYSTRKDVLLRVRGIHIHSIGRLSLVASEDVSKTVLYVGHEQKEKSRRRLLELLTDVPEQDIDSIRDEALALYSDSLSRGSHSWEISSPEFTRRRLLSKSSKNTETSPADLRKMATEADEAIVQTQSVNTSNTWSDIVLPYPFVRDTDAETVRRVKTAASREMPLREKDLEHNAAGCGFDIELDVAFEEWTMGAWRQLVERKEKDLIHLDPTRRQDHDEDSKSEDISPHLRGSWAKPREDQAVVMKLSGNISSQDCSFSGGSQFSVGVNVSALRTDWEATTSKAINYSFVMMLVCLTQMLVLLRQVLHSQGHSAAARVSLLSVGWQTMLDALLCIMHFYMCLSMPPLFSAFASVSFFKLLIFCIIEMKYMAIIIQARNSTNGGQPTDVLRRQIALLHLRFYSAMAGSFILFFYGGDKYRLFYFLALYSFWMPQIILNIITEAKTPVHNYYIYGMSISRLFAPLYFLGIRDNFLREANPEAPYDPFTCQMVILWVAFQTALLLGQRKYGARFMIPARFLPPKFDYNRPIPASMLPPGALDAPVLPMESIEDRDTVDALTPADRHASTETSTTALRGRHQTTTRNRIRGNRSTPRLEMTTEHVATPVCNSIDSPNSTAPSTVVGTVHCLECSICYDGIDIRKRLDYMLAPCNHLFHRECLVQWMDVKMECPICRTELPPL